MRGRRRGERGQSTAFVAAMLFVMTLLVAVVANVGQAVNRRIALQIVADAGAYTGGSVMATGMNQLARWNKAMQYAWAMFSSVADIGMFAAFTIHDTSCDLADAAEGTYGTAMFVLRSLYRAENIGYSLLATSEAIRTSNYNAGDLFPHETLTYAITVEGRSGHFGVIAPSEEVPEGTPLKAVALLDRFPFLRGLVRPATPHNFYVCEDILPPRLEFRNRSYDVWYRRTGSATAFTWEVTAPATRGVMFNDLFSGGGPLIPEMKAAAVVRPVGGSIEEGKSEYVAKMEPLATVLNGPFNALLPGFLRTWVGNQVATVPGPYGRGTRIVVH